jgi:hypothetical protein
MFERLKSYSESIGYAAITITAAGLTLAGYLTGNKSPDLPVGWFFALGAGYMSAKSFITERRILRDLELASVSKYVV